MWYIYKCNVYETRRTKKVPLWHSGFLDAPSGELCVYRQDGIRLPHDAFRQQVYVLEPSAPFRQVVAYTDTLHCYFEGRKELFEGLAIERLETEWVSYPVLHFDMSTAKNLTKEGLERELDRKLFAYEKVYGREEKDIDANQRLQGLIERAYQQTGKGVVILIDEYDAPLLDVMHEDQNLPVLRNVMRNFYCAMCS